MKQTLLVTVAALTMSGSAFAQAPGNSAPNTQTSPQSAPPAIQSAPAEKMAPMNRGEDSRSGTTGSGTTGQSIGNQTHQAKPSDDGQIPRKNKGRLDTDDGQRSQNNVNRGDRSGNNASSDKLDKQPGITTGQAGSSAKLSAEQQTQVRTVITKQNVTPVTNVNFSISVGARVPRSISFHPLPADVVSLYPDWRGYEFFLVREEIVVVNPRTLEIVAVLDA